MNKGKVGEWVRHTSSSGKEYYFHVTKQISQWEKPREWLEYEKKHGPVPNTPSSSSKPHPNKVQQHQSHNSSTNHNNASSADQRERDRKSLSQSQAQQQHQGHQQHQNFNSTSHHNTTNNSSNNSSTSNSIPMQHQQQQPIIPSSTSTTSLSNVHHHSHTNTNFNSRPAVTPESNSINVTHHSFSTSTISGRNSLYNDIRHPSAAALLAAAALRDTRKPSEDLQAEDMDISPLDDSNSPVSTDSKSMAGGNLNAHSHLNSQSFHYQSQYHPHHYPSSKNLQDGSESSRDEPQRNAAFHHQHPNPNTGRLMHSGSSSSIGNNGYHGRDRDMRDSPRRPDRESSRDYRDKDNRDYRDSYREKDSRDRDRSDRLRRERDTRDSPRRHERDRNDRERDHRSRTRDRNNDHRDRLRHRSRSGSKLRDERSRSPRDRDNGTPEGYSGIETGGLGSIGALAALNTNETQPLPASLAQYFRQDLIAHVQDLPGDDLERQANKLSDEIMTGSSIQLSKVSAELKMARSLVRLTDIQATLQEQRILFIRQQIKNLEDSDRDNSSSMLGIETGDS